MQDEKEPESTLKPLTRRTLLQGASAATVVGMVASRSLSQTANRDKPTPSPASGASDKSKAILEPKRAVRTMS